MLITHSREKLLNSLIFFATLIPNCNQQKLFKLLFFLDCKVFRETGRTVTEMLYLATEEGPVPESLFSELKNPKSDLLEHVSIQEYNPNKSNHQTSELLFGRIKHFDPSWFSDRELCILRKAVKLFKDKSNQEMHLTFTKKGTPWHQVYIIENSPNSVIPFTIALDGKPGSLTLEVVKDLEEDYRLAKKIFG